MLNYETILSSYDDKLTLMQWLKKVEAALNDASAVSFKVNKKGDATLTFSIVFEDGSELESGEIVLQQGESVESAAIVNGHLILTLTNGDELDAGQLLNGDLNVSGDLAVTGKITGAEIVEDMTGYGFEKPTPANATLDYAYAGAVKTGNKLTLVVSVYVNPSETLSVASFNLGRFMIPADIMAKIIPASGQATGTICVMGSKAFPKIGPAQNSLDINTAMIKYDTLSVYAYAYNLNQLAVGVDYLIRVESTFLLGENLAA